ncbi:MAG: MCE family protein [Calothrix sp. SM1_5_4]|nr:MCE family protein [Calothrix sp. SM1_5_4]
MKKHTSHEIKVGIFVAVGIALFCLSVILLGGDRFFLSHTYSLKVRLPQVQGLARGSVVSLSGVPVGNIDRIDFIPGSMDVEVTMSVEQGVQSRITEGSKAAVKTQGALGDKYIFIEPGPMGGTPLKDGAIVETDKTPDILDLIASKGQEFGEVVEVIKEVRKLFQNMNHDGRSGKLMSNLVESSDQFGKLMGEARETFRLLRNDVVVPMSSVMKKIDNGQGTLGALINDPSLHSRLSGFLGETPRNRFLKPLIRDSIQTNEQRK